MTLRAEATAFLPAPVPAAAPPPLHANTPIVTSTTLLMVGSDESIPNLVPALRQQFKVLLAVTVADAIAVIERDRPDIIVSDLTLRDGTAAAVCAAAGRFDPRPTVLVTASAPDGVPDALAAGCDGVLLRPFPPNLLHARIGRLLRDRVRDLRMRSNVRLRQNGALPGSGGTNRVWPDEHCPNCHTSGVISFEFHSHRRAWFACTACRAVWIGRRLEDF